MKFPGQCFVRSLPLPFPRQLRLASRKATMAFACLLLLSLASPTLAAPPPNQEELPKAEALMEKAIARIRQVQAQPHPPRFVYLKTSVTEELDSKDKVQSKQEKEYEVTQVGTATRQRLLKLNGKELAETEAKSHEARMRKQRGESSDPVEKPKDRGRERSGWLTEDLIRKFEYQVHRREVLQGRSCVLLSFKPRAHDLPATQLADRIFNKLSGSIWFDEQESEICRLEVSLKEKVSVWGGLLGSIQSFDMNLQRERSSYGPWFNKSFKLTLEGRRFLDTLRLRVAEEARDFQRRE
ncbi:MAG: hypothetical protein FJ404_00255 [Verrucomicrobia bacterium]|nr:hypothetical protein [Verrucomicrobiota bacterium]